MTTPTSYPTRMSDADAVLWALSADPGLRMPVLTVIELDEAPDPDRLRYAVERTVRAVPRFRQRVVADPLGLAAPRWEDDPHFDLNYHVRRVRLAGGGSIEDVFALAEPMAMQAFDPARPLWEWLFVEGLDGGRAAMIGKVHHAITDGVGGVDLALNFFDLEPFPERGELPEPATSGSREHAVLGGAVHEARVAAGAIGAGLRLAVRGTRAALGDPVGSAREIDATVRSVGSALVAGTPLSDLMSGRSLSIRYATLDFAVADFRRTAKANGVKINDVVLAATAAGMAGYHRHHGSQVDQLRFSMMVSTRGAETATSGNAFVGARLLLPLVAADPAGLRAVRAAAVAAAEDPVVGLSTAMFGLMRRLPGAVTLPMAGGIQRSVDVISSNVMGWPVPIWVGGAKARRVIPFGPLAGAGVNVTLLSHEERFHVGIIVDPAAVPDLDVLVQHLREGFQQTLTLVDSDLDRELRDVTRETAHRS